MKPIENEKKNLIPKEINYQKLFNSYVILK